MSNDNCPMTVPRNSSKTPSFSFLCCIDALTFCRMPTEKVADISLKTCTF